MIKNTQEKSLTKINESNIVYKLKVFLKNLFYKNETVENISVIENHIDKFEENETKKAFIKYVKTIEDEETKLLKLQKQYRNGEISEKNLSEEHINLLCELYDKQIDSLQKSNKSRKQKLLEYRMKMQNT